VGNGTGIGNDTMRPSPSATSPAQSTGAANSLMGGERVMGVELRVFGVAVVAALVGCVVVL
jgi:hypothetical protein